MYAWLFFSSKLVEYDNEICLDTVVTVLQQTCLSIIVQCNIYSAYDLHYVNGFQLNGVSPIYGYQHDTSETCISKKAHLSKHLCSWSQDVTQL